MKIVRGRDLLCREGCQNNPLSLLQVLAYDYPARFKGGWFLVMGKGFDADLAEQLRVEGYKKGIVAGHCAVEEVGEALRTAFGKRKVFFSNNCNNLAETVSAMLSLAGMTILDLIPIPNEQLQEITQAAQKAGSHALIPSF